MKIYFKNDKIILNVNIITKIDNLNNNEIYFFDFNNYNENKKFIKKYIKNKYFGILIHSIKQLIILQNSKFFHDINNILFNYNLLKNEEIHFLYFINKNCYILDDNYLNFKKYNKILLNPLISGICNISQSFIDNIKNYTHSINYQYEIKNKICHININKIIEYFDIETYDELIIKKISIIFNYFLIYNIFNFPTNLSDQNIINFYNNLCIRLGEKKICHPVNDRSTLMSDSRDIKYDSNNPNNAHFYISNERQPLHNDYAYYPLNKSSDWLILFCLKSSKYGGYTSLITTKKLEKIMKLYEIELYKKISNLNITYLYKEFEKNDILHEKKLFDINTKIINWNYFQIKEEYNNKNIINIKEEFFNFLNKNITFSKIYDINKIWKRGDSIIFNDHLVLHERSGFYGDRYLKDMSFINDIKLY